MIFKSQLRLWIDSAFRLSKQIERVESIRKWPKVICVYSAWAVLWTHASYLPHVAKFLNMIVVLIKNNGLVYTIKYIKDIRLCVTRYMCGSPLSRSPSRFGLQKCGWPRAIRYLKPSQGESFRNVLTLLNVLRFVEGVLPPSLNDIEDKWEGHIPAEILVFLEKVFKPRYERFFTPLEFKKYHFSTHREPNGHAISSVLNDALSYDEKSSNALLGVSPEVHKRMMNFLKLNEIVPLRHKLCRALFLDKIISKPAFARLVCIPAPEGKSRIIGEMNFWAQCALKPLHDKEMKALRSIRQDLTFYQGIGPQVLKLHPGSKYYSFDLKSATDRFPVELQEKVIQAFYGEDFARSWRSLITDQAFAYGESEVRYGCGQPIGAYSSWATFTLCHHMIVQMLCHRYRAPRSHYIILGDDIVIAHDKVAEGYCEIMRALSVDISDLKTHVSKDSYEIAKRWFVNGEEITPFPINSIIESGFKSAQVIQALMDASVKGWRLFDMITPAAALFISLQHASNFKNAFGRIHHDLKVGGICTWVLKYLRGYIDGVSMLRNIQIIIDRPVLPCLSSAHYINDGVINNLVVEIFSDSAASPGKGHQDVAFEAMPLITNPEEGVPIALEDAQDAIPHLGIYGQIEEQYLEIIQIAFNFDQFHNGKWDLSLRALIVPDTSTVFSIRNHDIRTLVSSKIAARLVERIKVIAESPYGI
ncbi:RNA-dependent RNA polymerase [Helicobasidium mompa mitovirus 1-18]|uniref:RNA-dependent RNA polymerase n=1 Tax=Helicobasidium mompa mitovirus 1-18 TaxID=233046 RepID=A0ABM7E882_9VIRU|nr:RNA-dependent RNA polymerase [Helicobasidium mompa mitovirus 1-18]BAD72871.1 RNA-dependent RNA polymerase [Helicobasidium mompa mitovirus 1-18]